MIIDRHTHEWLGPACTLPDNRGPVVDNEKGGAMDTENQGVLITVVGVGGGAIAALNHMLNEPLCGIDFIAVDTDRCTLEDSLAPRKIPLGSGLPEGAFAKGDIQANRQAALEDIAMIKFAIRRADMVIVVACLGGGTGSGAAPVIARAAKELGALVVPVVTRPFLFEGKKRLQATGESMEELLVQPGSLMHISCHRLKSMYPKKAYEDFLLETRATLNTAVRGITDPVLRKGWIGYDFADHRAVLDIPGIALTGTGQASGLSRARNAATQAITCLLFEGCPLNVTRGVLGSLTGGPDTGIEEVAETMTLIQEAFPEDARVYFTFSPDESAGDTLTLTVTATGIPFDEF